MTSPTSGSEHVSRYRALGEFDNLVRAAKEAKKALKELREEEAKLNAQSLAEDKKIVASKQARAKAEKDSADAAKQAAVNLNKDNAAGKAGQSAGVSYTQGLGKGIASQSGNNDTQRLVSTITSALQKAFADAGEKSATSFRRGVVENVGKESRQTSDIIVKSLEKVREGYQKLGEDAGAKFNIGVRERFRRDKDGIFQSSGFEYSVREWVNKIGGAGEESGALFIKGVAKRMERLNETLTGSLQLDELDLDVDIKDAVQSIAALEFELNELSNKTSNPRIRIDSNRALVDLRAIQKLFRDEVAEDMIKESQRIRKELEKVDSLPSGKAFKFWALTAMSDMARVFAEAERGTSVFEKLRTAASSGGGGGNFLRTFVSGFDDFSESSSALLQKLGRVSGELYRMPGIIAVLVASLPALIAGMAALGGGALGLASGLGAALGVVAAFPAAAIALSTAVGALSSTFSGFGDILKEAKKAQTEEAIAKEQSRLGTDKALTAQQKYNLMLREMGPATGKATEAVVKFSEAWGKLQGRVGENFFREVSSSVGDLNALLPMMEDLLGRSATALGKVARAGLDLITSGPWKSDFKEIAKTNAVILEDMGFAVLEVADAFRNITVAAGPFSTWLVRSIREGAAAFADWSKYARGDGTIAAFLDETKESLQVLWQIFKNLGNVVVSFFKSTVDEGQNYLRTLEDITGHWADVAEAQEAANSPLREWLVQIRPILGALGALVADLARGISGLATNQNSIKSMVDLLDSLRTDVLPPILRILQQLNDSGIAVTVVRAIGDILDAIATFLESGATQALTVFITVLAKFFGLLASIASLPGVSDVLGGVAAGIAAIAAVSIVARFTGLFKLWDFFTWMTRNKGNLSGAFSDAARGVAGLQTNSQGPLPNNIPSTISSVGGVGSEAINNQARAMDKAGTAAQNATGKISIFSRAMNGISSAGNSAKNALSGVTDFLGGPWGAALAGAAVVGGVIAADLAKQKKAAEDTKNAYLALADAYGALKEGDTSGVEGLLKTDEAFRVAAESAEFYGISLTDLSGALAGNEQAGARVNATLDSLLAGYKAERESLVINEGQYRLSVSQVGAFRAQIKQTADAQKDATAAANANSDSIKTYKDRLGGLTQQQVDNSVAASGYESTVRLLSSALDTLSDATATASDRSRALSDIIKAETGEMERANEATEDWSTRLLDLKDALSTNGNTLSTHTREGLRNRDALQAAARATRDLYLEDIAAGVPMDKATERHRKRTEQLIKEAGKNKETRSEAKLLVDMYGKIPDDVSTKFSTSGYDKVYENLQRAKFLQESLQKGISVNEASGLIEKDLAEARRGSGGRGDGYGVQKFATGGPVWGAGTKTSDSIRAWLSNGEFVQPTDAVEHYGLPLMEAIRTRKLDKDAISEALPDSGRTTFASGGQAHSANCAACASGGHKFAQGGSATWPISVNMRGTKIDKDWTDQFSGGALGGGGGGKGYQWQMSVLRKQFPGLDLWSGFRPGSRTLSGNQSYHSLGRAVDVAPRRDVAQWIRANYGARTKELITPFNDLNLHNGKPHRYTGAVWNQHNFAGGNAHNHWAFNKGGLVDLMGMMNMNSLAPSQNTPLPTTPRTLSPAASSVVNNSTDNTRAFGDVIINNPMPERAGDSVRDALYRTTLLY